MDTNKLNNIWNNCLALIEEECTPLAFNTWIKSLAPISYKNGVLLLSTDNEVNRNFIVKRYSSLIKQSFKEVTGELPEMEVIIKTQAEEEKKVKNTQNKYEKYTFDNFVVGGSNRMAHAVCAAVAEEPGMVPMYNPLFLYGGVGLGKTHLIHAIKNYINENSPEIKIALVTSENFTNELVAAIRENKPAEFREKYRKMDVLLIDDIQFIAGKKSIEEEFFNTFNVLHEANKQIVITSDRPPEEIKTLEERLISRFKWGLQCDIQPPDFDTKLAILKNKAREINLEVDDQIFYLICESVNSNVRELEGALNRIAAYKSLVNREITLELAEEALKSYGPREGAAVTPVSIIDYCARFFNITVDELKSDNRKKDISSARQITMFVIREITGLSFPKIGALFGKDHSTAMYAIKSIEEKISTDPLFKVTVSDIIKDIKTEQP